MLQKNLKQINFLGLKRTALKDVDLKSNWNSKVLIFGQFIWGKMAKVFKIAQMPIFLYFAVHNLPKN